MIYIYICRYTVYTPGWYCWWKNSKCITVKKAANARNYPPLTRCSRSSIGRCSGDQNEAKPVGDGERTKGAPQHLPALAMQYSHFIFQPLLLLDAMFVLGRSRQIIINYDDDGDDDDGDDGDDDGRDDDLQCFPKIVWSLDRRTSSRPHKWPHLWQCHASNWHIH